MWGVVVADGRMILTSFAVVRGLDEVVDLILDTFVAQKEEMHVLVKRERRGAASCESCERVSA